ncbi:uracil-DNA glycosylase family protein [Enterococcus sp. AZ103]|uniref:uracil-DNA glycosylase family protein n=1 Tax=Enterococcus sp. AZ103 TaxID=2774628 RepID=UPI003F213D37
MLEKNFDQFVNDLENCTRCANILNPAPVFLGNQDAKIVHISQAPSYKVSQTKKPFTDASGKKLRDEWYQVNEETFYDPAKFCFLAVGLCYPGKNKSGGDKQPPTICSKLWLDPALDYLQNKLFILVGNKAAQHFFKGQDFAELIFQTQEIHGKPTIVLPHPSPLNIKWFKDHPDFYQYRLPEIRAMVQTMLEK